MQFRLQLIPQTNRQGRGRAVKCLPRRGTLGSMHSEARSKLIHHPLDTVQLAEHPLPRHRALVELAGGIVALLVPGYRGSGVPVQDLADNQGQQDEEVAVFLRA